MPSLIYTSYWDDTMRAAINSATATYMIVLTTSAYTEDKNAHLTRANLTGEVANGNGYTTGGLVAAAATLTKDTGNSRMTLSLPGGTWTTGAGQTLTARKAVYLVRIGGAAAAGDRLVCVVDFSTDQVASNGGTLTLSASTITLQN